MLIFFAAMGLAQVPTSTRAAESPAADVARYGEKSQESDEIASPAETVVVTGSRREELAQDAVVATEVITRREVEQSGAENLAELLEEHPGVQIDRSFAGAGIRLQGFDPEHTLILVDGRRLNGRVDGVLDLQRISAERIERVELVKGPASALWGSDALGGVVNIITRQPEAGVEASAHVAAGTLNDDRRGLFDVGGANTLDVAGRVAGGTEKLRGSVTAGFHHQGAFDLDASNAGTSGSDFDTWNLEANGRWFAADRVDVDAWFDILHRQAAGVDVGADLTNPGAGVVSPDNPFVVQDPVFDRSNTLTTWSAAARPTFSLAPGHKLWVMTSFSRFEDNFVRDQRGDDSSDLNQNTVDDLGQVTVQYDGTFGPRHRFTAGTEFLFERLVSDRIRENEDGARDWNRGRVSAYAQHEWEVVPELRLVPGFRLDADTQFGTVPAPKVAVRWDPFEFLGLRASYGVGFRAPSVRELFLIFENPGAGYVVLGNEGLEPEVSRGLNLGAVLDFDVPVIQSIGVEANFYRNDIDNLFVFVPTDEVPGLQTFTNENVDTAVTQGVESVIRFHWTDFLSTDVGYTYLDGRDTTLDRALPGRSPHRITFRAMVDYRPWGLSFFTRGSWVDQAPFYDDAESTEPDDFAPAFVTLDFRVEKTLGDYLSMFVGGDNLLNAGDPQLNPLLPRGVYVGLNGFFQ